MDIQKAITYPFDDQRWLTKTAIGALLLLASFLIIPFFFVQGYLVKIVRNVMAGEEHPLPEWHDWGKLFMDGLYLSIATLVYTLPIWLLLGCGALFFLPAGLTEGDVSEALAGIGALSFGLFGCLALIFGIVLAVLGPAITIQYAREGTLASCFRFGEIFAIARDQIGNIIIALLVIMGISFVLGLIGVIPIIGWIIALAAGIYTTFVSGHLFGQIGRKVGGAMEKAPTDPTMLS